MLFLGADQGTLAETGGVEGNSLNGGKGDDNPSVGRSRQGEWGGCPSAMRFVALTPAAPEAE